MPTLNMSMKPQYGSLPAVEVADDLVATGQRPSRDGHGGIPACRRADKALGESPFFTLLLGFTFAFCAGGFLASVSTLDVLQGQGSPWIQSESALPPGTLCDADGGLSSGYIDVRANVQVRSSKIVSLSRAVVPIFYSPSPF